MALKKLPSLTDQTVNQLCERIEKSAQNWLMAQVGMDKMRLSRRLRLIYHGLRGNLKTKIIRPNDIVVLDRMKFNIMQHCLINGLWRLMGIKYKRFCNVRSEANGNLVIEWF